MSHLYKKFVNERVAALIAKTEQIRNITVIAHIDHGKTTLTDSLIADSGLLSKEVAASARLLDYDQIEQQRGITIKASGISLLHSFQEKEYLINLIDTPGHIDFSSHVTRGLRLTDGAIIVVDAIEGIMVQTETVTRQAMQESVKPVLFINKVDRLMREKRLSPRKTAEEITRVVREFNAMLGKYLDDEHLEQWEVSFNRGSLVVGSALDKWGLDIDTLKGRTGGSEDKKALGKAFVEILTEIDEIYRAEKRKELTNIFPVAPVVLNSAIRTIPDPPTAQKYRVPLFWKGDPNSNTGKSLLRCDTKGRCVCLVGDVQPDKHATSVSAVRIFSGTLDRAEPLTNMRTNKEAKSLQIGLFMSKTRVDLPSVPAGNLAFITGLKDVAVGDTLVSDGADFGVSMTGLQYPMEPVVTYAVEPKKLSELSSIQQPIEEYVKSDPALEFEVNSETGEMLLSGAGELHVEITIEKLARLGINVTLGAPMVMLREQMTKDGETRTEGGEDTSTFTVEAILPRIDATPESLGTVLDTESGSNCWLIDVSGKINPYGDENEWVKEGFRTLIRNGPLRGEKMRRLWIVIKKLELSYTAPESSWREITQPLLRAARESVLSGNPTVLEPWIRLEISAPEEHIGNLSTILAKRKGHILEIDSERTLYRIEAEIPVRESFGLANEIRTSTSGWATWGARSGGFRSLNDPDVRYD
ncbi:MAG: GTP-binding protein [Candidatus Thorarchaeota archaeon]